jgi:hypothetical protein
VVVQTRWNEDDLSGYLLDSEKDEPEGWHIVNMPASQKMSRKSSHYPALWNRMIDCQDGR